MTRTLWSLLVLAGLIGLMYGLTRIRQGMPHDIYDLDDTPVEDREDWGQR